jgi:predicted RNA-binding Zn ribbon-like protein
MSEPFVWHDHHFITGVHGLDFANTIVWRNDPERREDRVQHDSDLVGWMRAAGLAPEHGVLAPSLASRMAIDRYFRNHDPNAWAELAGCYAQAMALAFSPDAARVKVCGNCGWLFIDRTRNRNKRWCTAGMCGARTRSRRYYARQKTQAARKLSS